MKVALIGVNGQLGTDINRCFYENGIKVYGLKHKDIEVCDPERVNKSITKIDPDLVINTSAFHNVDSCEDEVMKAFEVNVLGVKNLVDICLKIDIPLIHFSTDYVFDGTKNDMYIETDCPNPINIYGISKHSGELLISYKLQKYFIIRVSGLYGHAGSSGKGGNFIELMIRLAKENKDIKVVNDQILTPTNTQDIVKKMLELIGLEEYGIYHMTNSGYCSWYDFAEEIFKLMDLKPKFEPVKSEVFGAKAKRPYFSVLDNKHLREEGLQDLRHWKLALKEYINNRNK
jgi:dTDP-4-dehydrorhamnose reductase